MIGSFTTVRYSSGSLTPQDHVEEALTSSAVGVASKNDRRIGRANEVSAHAIKRLRSVFDIPPIGLMSADEQSYLMILAI